MRLPQLVTIASILTLPHVAAIPTPEPEKSDPLISGFSNFVSWFRSHGGTSKSCCFDQHDMTLLNQYDPDLFLSFHLMSILSPTDI